MTYSTSRGRGPTRVVIAAALLLTLVLASAFLVVGGAGANAEAPAPAPTPRDPGPALGSVQTAASQARSRAAEVADALVEAATPPPPPPVHCPVPGSHFVDSWGFARSGGRAHKGVDLMAPHGTPIFAPVAGVIRPSNSALGGIGFYLDDADGNEFFGSHLASLDVTGPVEAGQQIGTVGSTGNAGSAHLHFEVKPAGRASVNPFPYASNWCTTDFTDPAAEVLLPGD